MIWKDKVFRYFRKNDRINTEIVIYDPSIRDHYFQSFHSIVLENSFHGTIVCLGDVHIRKNASFSGELICKTCKIEGHFSGNLLSAEYTGVCKGAVLDAKILTASIFIENHAIVHGVFNITKDIKTPASVEKLSVLYQQTLSDDEKSGPEVQGPSRTILRGNAQKAVRTRLEVPAPADKVKGGPIENTDKLAVPVKPETPAQKDNIKTSGHSAWW